jgi:hypothetical protein
MKALRINHDGALKDCLLNPIMTSFSIKPGAEESLASCGPCVNPFFKALEFGILFESH